MWHTEYLLFSESHFTGNILSLHEFLEMLCAGAITGHNFGDLRGETQASHGYHRSQNICSERTTWCPGASFTLKTAKANAEAPVNFAATLYQVRPGNDP